MESIDWIILIAFIAVAAYAAYSLLGPYFIQTPVSIGLSFASQSPSQIYPFEKVNLPLQISNLGSNPIENMNIQVYMNGNAFEYYTVTLPQGKSATISFNFTPDSAGSYAISAAADPGKLYDVADRNAAQSAVYVNVSAYEKADPWSLLPSGNVTSTSYFNGTPLALVTLDLLKSEYGISLLHNSQTTGFDNVFWPMFNVTNQYIRNVSIAYANYSGGSSAYSVWLRAYLVPSVVKDAESGAGLYTLTTQMDGINVTYSRYGKTSVCSWYSEGWIKIVEYSDSNCTSAASGSIAGNYLHGYAYQQPVNITLPGNYSSGGINASYAYALGNSRFGIGRMGVLGDGIAVPMVAGNSDTSKRTCYGTISTYGNVSVCSTYLFASGQRGIGPTSVVMSTRLTSRYNASMILFVNTSALSSNLQLATNYLDSLKLNGTGVGFTSALQSSCSFESRFSCTYYNFTNSTLDIGLDSINGTSKVVNAQCFYGKAGKSENESVYVGNSVKEISINCYDGANRISGVALGLNLTVKIGYTVGNSVGDASGSAMIFGI